jgi:hypothetical protein
MRQRQQQFRRQQDEQARREVEDWTAAWREEEMRSRQQDYSPEEDTSNAYPNHPRPRNGEEELRLIVQESADPEERELAKSMFPWLKF